jgi:tetratricopeptide (TPR) repeat protein
LARIYAEQSKGLAGLAREEKLAAAGEQYKALCLRSEPHPWHLVLYVDFLLECEDWPTADQALKRLERLAPDRPDSVLLRARWLERQGRTAEIQPLLEAFDQSLEKRIPDSQRRAQACAAIGELCSSFALNAAAEAWYRKAVVLENGYYAPLASALVRQGKTAEAAQLCLREARRAGTAQAAIILADILVAGQAAEDQQQLAEPVLSRALGDHAQNPDLLLAVANLRVLQNRPREAISFYEAVLRVRPRDAVAMNNLATLLSEEPGGIRAALQYIDEAIRIRGHQPALLATKGMILVHDRRPAEAVPVLRKAVEGPQADPRHHFHLAVALQRVGDTGEARRVLQTALDNRLTKHVLTPADYRLLEELKQTLLPNNGRVSLTVDR